MRRPSPMEQEFAKGLATLICAYRWRAGEAGAPHNAAEPCPACRRLIYEDLHGVIGHLLFGAYVRGHGDAEDGAGVEVDLPEFDAVVAAVTERAAEISREHLERVVQSDPRTFERSPQPVSGRPSTADWTPQRPWEEQRPWGSGRAIDLVRLRRAIHLDCATIGPTQFVVSVPDDPQNASGAFVNFHPRRPLDAPPCECQDWRRGDLCEHVLCVLIHVGDREVVQALRRLVPAVEGSG